ncbi:MAG: hypothetical protein UX10_C0008G0012 [Candidatus Magasanikbacteria bacterium GW2011_GWA2_45_39]|uniref:S-layer domain-containing protein n=1 Tax=Candidatus Magasanikbacteria bacterium GW2011_GWA2_45_39 TaxID=1619041 RepID=A0A0G1MHE5_9BACT|nr:MAG: hypothetical protein UX10_C0008G0012 [Candidatus Magasanikbacteria bacterium GW2011_GWA2_45_39]HBW73754.1 hypothetical protein [Candidatus Magasanikbacteria bacterium]
MFDQAPNNLPIEPEDILADGDGSSAISAGATGSVSSDVTQEAPPTALSAGRLRPATSPSSLPAQSASISSGANLSPARSFSASMSDNPRDTASGDMQSDVEISPPILNKRNLFIIAVVVLVVFIAGGAFWVWRSSTKRAATPSAASVPQAETPVAPAATLNENVPVSAPNVTATTTETVAQPPSPAVDADGDGLTDQQEIQYGTDPQKADTDGDDLTDYEEIFIWHTNPLNPDTDGDGYSDGQEVKNGFNPNGSGKLLNIPAAATSSSASSASAPTANPVEKP